MLRFSVITPSYNQGAFIEATIKSVLDQKDVALNYKVFDGGSQDTTVATLHRFEPALWFRSGKDGGQADAVNQGLQAADGDIIAWLNSDDIYYPDTLRRVAEAFERHPEADFVYGKAHHIDQAGRILEPYYTESWNYERLLDVCFLCQPAVFFRRRVVERIGLLDASLRYCMDYEYWIRAAQAQCQFVHIPDYLAGSRMYADNKTLSARVAVHHEMNTMLRRRLGHVPLRWLSNYAHAVVDGKGVARTDHARFVRQLAWHLLYAGLRWNGRLERETVALAWEWNRHHLPRLLRKGT
jgi:glycosyltransferase involved in cell wall biosynthesis